MRPIAIALILAMTSVATAKAQTTGPTPDPDFTCKDGVPTTFTVAWGKSIQKTLMKASKDYLVSVRLQNTRGTRFTGRAIFTNSSGAADTHDFLPGDSYTTSTSRIDYTVNFLPNADKTSPVNFYVCLVFPTSDKPTSAVVLH
jgi:hypothetical protein